MKQQDTFQSDKCHFHCALCMTVMHGGGFVHFIKLFQPQEMKNVKVEHSGILNIVGDSQCCQGIYEWEFACD